MHHPTGENPPKLAKPGRAHTVGRRGQRAIAVAPMGYPAPVGVQRTTRAAGDDTTDRAQLHPRIVDGEALGGLFVWGATPAGQSPRPRVSSRLPKPDRCPKREDADPI